MNIENLKKITCCGIVLYNPEISKLKKNIDVLYSQVECIILVDNCSENVCEIKELIRNYDCKKIIYIRNNENYGIAKALNQILKFAHINKFDWYITMDQDSICSKLLMKEYSKVISKLDNVAVLCPFVLNNNKISYNEYKMLKLSEVEVIKQPIECITSASLNNVKKAMQIGGYMEELFIDCVDVDFNIRLINKGFKIYKVNNAYMYQEMGVGKKVYIISLLHKLTKLSFLRKLKVTPVYNNIRLYYISRNSRFIYSIYKKAAGSKMSNLWMYTQFIYYFITYPLEINRVKMLKSILKGIKDSEELINNFRIKDKNDFESR